MILKGQSIRSLLARPIAGIRVVLFYGPDDGQVHELGARAARTVVADLGDPFRVADLGTAALVEEPARLVDEADARSLVGGRRVVRVRDAADGCAVAVGNLLDAATDRTPDPEDSLVVLEAGDLPAKSTLRKLTEKHDLAAVIACYRDEGRSLSDVVQESLASHGLTATPEAMEHLVSQLGGDRGVSRRELDKLALYMAGPDGGTTVTLDDAATCVGDGRALGLDSAVMAATDGRVDRIDTTLDRLFEDGVAPVAALRTLSTHLMRLQFLAAAVAEGQPLKQAMQRLQPRVFWKLQDQVAGQVRFWTIPATSRALSAVRDAEIRCKSTGYPDQLMCRSTFLSTARLAAAARHRR